MRKKRIDIKKDILIAKKMLLEEGATQAHVAETLGYSRKAVNQWVSRYDWDLSKAKELPPAKLKHSLSHFMGWFSKNDPTLYKEVEQVYQKFIRMF